MTPDALAAIHADAMEVPGPWTAKDFTDLIAAPGTFLVPHPSTNGFALGRVVADEAELLTLAVSPTARRRGLGRWCHDTF